MKIAATMAAMALLLGMSSIAKAQDGNPFKYTITGDFVDGEPNSTYTSSGGTAFVQLGVAVLFDVVNKDTRTRNSSPLYSAYPTLSAGIGPFALPPAPPAPQGASGSASDVVMMPGQKLTYSLNFLTDGNVAIGTYTARVDFIIQDAKTTDIRSATKTKSVTVN